MTIVLAWIIAIIAMLSLFNLGHRIITSLPDTIERYAKLRERIKRDKLLTEKLKQEVINEQLKNLDEE